MQLRLVPLVHHPWSTVGHCPALVEQSEGHSTGEQGSSTCITSVSPPSTSIASPALQEEVEPI